MPECADFAHTSKAPYSSHIHDPYEPSYPNGDEEQEDTKNGLDGWTWAYGKFSAYPELPRFLCKQVLKNRENVKIAHFML